MGTSFGYPPRGTAGHSLKDLREASRVTNKSLHLKARGNLSYLDFIRVVDHYWTLGHPNVPFFASSPATQAKYPCITYSLQMRKTHPSEPKPRLREHINTGKAVINEDGDVVLSNPGIIIYGWRFVNLVKFTVHDEVKPNGAQTVEELIEVFEDFMQEHMPVFKQLGASDLMYNQRLADEELNRNEDDIVRRAVNFRLTTEKINVVEIDKINDLCATIRIDGYNDDATPSLINPYEPFYEEVLEDPSLTLASGLFQRVSIIDDHQTIPPE